MLSPVQKSIAVATCRNFPYATVSDAPLVHALEQAGCRAETVVWNDPTVRWDRFDACVIRSTWDWHLDPDGFRVWLSKVSSCTTLFNPYELVIWGLDKRYLLELGRAGVPVVPCLVIPAKARYTIPAAARARGWSRVVIKPSLGASAYRAGLVDLNGDDPQGWSNANQDWNGVAIVQPFLSSIQQHGETSVICIDSHPTHAVQKVPKPGDFRVQSEFGGSERLVPVGRDALAVVERCLRALPSRAAYARIDLVRGADGEPLVIECEVVEPTLYLELYPLAALRLSHLIASSDLHASRTDRTWRSLQE